MPDNDKLVPEMRASLDRMTSTLSGESKEDLAKDYDYAVSSGKPTTSLTKAERQAMESYRKYL